VDVFADVPSIVPAAQTTETQHHGGVTITVAPTQFDTVGRTKCKYRLPQATLFTIAPTGASNETHRKLLEVQYHDIDVNNRDLAFAVTIRNGMTRVFRGSGALVQFNLDSHVQAVEQSGYLEFLNVLIPPMGEAQVHIAGPALSSLKDGATLGVFLYDVVTAIDNAGTVTHRDNFEWYFRVNLRHVMEKSTLVATNVWVPHAQLRYVAEELPGGGLRFLPDVERCLNEGVIVEGRRGVPQARVVSVSDAAGQASPSQQAVAVTPPRSAVTASTPAPSYSASLEAGLAAARAGKRSDAIRELETAYRLNAFHRDILYNLASQYILDSVFAKGISVARGLVAIDPANPDAYQLLVTGYSSLSKQLRATVGANRTGQGAGADSVKATSDSAAKYQRLMTALPAKVTFSQLTAEPNKVRAVASVMNNTAARRSFRIILTYLDVSGGQRGVDTLTTGVLSPKETKNLTSEKNAAGVAGFKYRVQ
jgi:hypothetical protein